MSRFAAFNLGFHYMPKYPIRALSIQRDSIPSRNILNPFLKTLSAIGPL